VRNPRKFATVTFGRWRQNWNECAQQRKIPIFGGFAFSAILLRRDTIKIFGGSLKGYRWNSFSSYNYFIGYYCFIANSLIQDGTINAFEPLPENISAFQKLLDHNSKRLGKVKIELLPYAISSKEQYVVFSNNLSAIGGNTYKNQ
jgi:hypothetical protein